MSNNKIKRIIAVFISITIFSCVIITSSSCNKHSINNNPKKDVRLTDEMAQSLNTIKRLDNIGKLYEMNVEFDYYNDVMQKMMNDQNYIKQEHGCIVFLTHNENDEIITCRNFDTNHRAKNIEDAQGVYIIYYCHQDGLYKSVSISDAKYCGEEAYKYHPGTLDDGHTDISAIIYGIYDPLDGINEKGLTVSVMSSDIRKDEKTYDLYKPGLQTCVIGALMRYMLDECANVDEAVNLASKYNIIPYLGSNKIDHIFVADANGNSKVIEWRNNEIRVTDTDISTNFYQTWDDPEPHKVKTSKQYENDSQLSKTYMNYQYGYGHGYDRFNIVASTFQQYAVFDNNIYKTRLPNELAKNLLSLVAQQITPELTSLTQYSVIYNSNTLSADIWLSRDYSKKYSFGIDYKR